MKIFIAVGTQLAFDRLLEAVDNWAAEHPEAEIFAQAGPAKYRAKHMKTQHFVAPSTFEQKSQEADLIIAHAGTGSIFTALELGTPIIVMPRLAKFGEHRNDHQVATVERFEKTVGINVAHDEAQLRRLLDDVENLRRPVDGFSAVAEPRLLSTVSDFVNEEAPRLRPVQRVFELIKALRP